MSSQFSSLRSHDQPVQQGHSSKLERGPLGGKFFVWVIESPKPKEFLDDYSEGRALREGLRLCGIPVYLNVAVDEAHLDEALGARLAEIAERERRWPIFHLCLHGCADGIGLTFGPVVEWVRLAQKLSDRSQVLEGGLMLTTSACFGALGSRMAQRNEEPPFEWLVGHGSDVYGSHAVVGFMAFFHHLERGASLLGALDAMRVASGDDGFQVVLGESVRKDYVMTQQIIEALAREVQSSPFGIAILGGRPIPEDPPRPTRPPRGRR